MYIQTSDYHGDSEFYHEVMHHESEMYESGETIQPEDYIEEYQDK